MKTSDGPIIDMTPTGGFVNEPIAGPTLGVIIARVIAFALVLGIAAIAFWLAVFTIPVLIVLGLVGYGYLRFRMARHGVRFRSVVVRPARR